MQFNNRSFLASMPPVTKHLIFINVIMWLATMALQRAGIIDLERWLALHFWKASDFIIVQFFTNMFMHDTRTFMHIFFNMFMLWMFGILLERVLGSKRFLFYYIACGLGASLAQELMWEFTWEGMYQSFLVEYPGLPVEEFCNVLMAVGASGAIFGILLAFGMLFPNMPMYIFFIPVPIKAKWVVIGNGLLELYFGVSGHNPGVAHFAHLGGMIAGIIIILYWRHNGTLRKTNGIY